jgi:hypothetical protein
MKIFSNIKNTGGYTIIETMVAISVFLVVIMYGTTALLNVNLLHRKSGDLRSIMDSLTFIMEDMSRNLRVGYDYNCYDSVDDMPSAESPEYSIPRDCENGVGLAFERSDGGDQSDPADQWLYYIDEGKIFKSTNANNDVVQLTTDEEVEIGAGSGFTVIGTEEFPGDEQQPFVIIRLVGTITYKDIITPFSIQTSVSQRLIDS